MLPKGSTCAASAGRRQAKLGHGMHGGWRALRSGSGKEGVLREGCLQNGMDDAVGRELLTQRGHCA